MDQINPNSMSSSTPISSSSFSQSSATVQPIPPLRTASTSSPTSTTPPAPFSSSGSKRSSPTTSKPPSSFPINSSSSNVPATSSSLRNSVSSFANNNTNNSNTSLGAGSGMGTITTSPVSVKPPSVSGGFAGDYQPYQQAPRRGSNQSTGMSGGVGTAGNVNVNATRRGSDVTTSSVGSGVGVGRSSVTTSSGAQMKKKISAYSSDDDDGDQSEDSDDSPRGRVPPPRIASAAAGTAGLKSNSYSDIRSGAVGNNRESQGLSRPIVDYDRPRSRSRSETRRPNSGSTNSLSIRNSTAAAPPQPAVPPSLSATTRSNTASNASLGRSGRSASNAGLPAGSSTIKSSSGSGGGDGGNRPRADSRSRNSSTDRGGSRTASRSATPTRNTTSSNRPSAARSSSASRKPSQNNNSRSRSSSVSSTGSRSSLSNSSAMRKKLELELDWDGSDGPVLMSGVLTLKKKGINASSGNMNSNKRFVILVCPNSASQVQDVYERVFHEGLPYVASPTGFSVFAGRGVPDISDPRVCGAFGYLAKSAVEKCPLLMVLTSLEKPDPVTFIPMSNVDYFISEVELGVAGHFALKHSGGGGKEETRFIAESSSDYQEWEGALRRALENARVGLQSRRAALAAAQANGAVGMGSFGREFGGYGFDGSEVGVGSSVSVVSGTIPGSVSRDLPSSSSSGDNSPPSGSTEQLDGKRNAPLPPAPPTLNSVVIPGSGSVVDGNRMNPPYPIPMQYAGSEVGSSVVGYHPGPGGNASSMPRGAYGFGGGGPVAGEEWRNSGVPPSLSSSDARMLPWTSPSGGPYQPPHPITNSMGIPDEMLYDHHQNLDNNGSSQETIGAASSTIGAYSGVGTAVGRDVGSDENAHLGNGPHYQFGSSGRSTPQNFSYMNTPAGYSYGPAPTHFAPVQGGVLPPSFAQQDQIHGQNAQGYMMHYGSGMSIPPGMYLPPQPPSIFSGGDPASSRRGSTANSFTMYQSGSVNRDTPSIYSYQTGQQQYQDQYQQFGQMQQPQPYSFRSGSPAPSFGSQSAPHQAMVQQQMLQQQHIMQNQSVIAPGRPAVGSAVPVPNRRGTTSGVGGGGGGGSITGVELNNNNDNFNNNNGNSGNGNSVSERVGSIEGVAPRNPKPVTMAWSKEFQRFISVDVAAAVAGGGNAGGTGGSAAGSVVGGVLSPIAGSPMSQQSGHFRDSPVGKEGDAGSVKGGRR
ncbi:hypothetical protein HDU76_004572 [Blyttiomyces sp. JEL0837]|nr:hypothetical protein HDU76_004572 [Blyttiomyces sp. JEL0837]